MSDFQSGFVFGLEGKRYQEFIDIIARPIIEEIVESNDYDIIPFSHHLSHKDFQNTKVSIFPDFYTNFLADIAKTDDKVSFRTKVCICLDERLCNEVCPKTGRKITAINIAGVNVVYFIFFEIKEFFTFVYGEPFVPIVEKQIEDEITNQETIQNQKQQPKYLDDASSDTETGLIKKYGFIHNINYDKKFAFVWLTVEDGIPLRYECYRNLDDFEEGDFLTMSFKKDSKFPEYVELSENQNEISNFVKRFKGKLAFPNNQPYAFINTSDNISIYVKPKLAETLIGNDNEIIECLAVFQNDKKKWRAEYVEI